MVKLDGPIPGESLTREPGNAPWEQPAKFSKVEDALAHHMKRLEDPEVIEDLIFILDQQFPLEVLVDSWMTMAVMEGYQNIDVSMLIAPILHEYIKALAEVSGVTVVETDGPTESEKQSAKQKERFVVMLESALQDSGGESSTVEGIKTAFTDEKTPPAPATEKPPTGVFKRRS